MNFKSLKMRKYSILLVVLAFISCTSFVSSEESTSEQTGGIVFEHDLQKAIEKAKETGKPIFIDVYATWCGPCKSMASKEFTQKSVGDFYNKNFINVKLDGEKGQGLSFAQEFKVQYYPSLFFITHEGRVIEKVIGGQNANELLKIGEKVLNKHE